MDVSSVWVGLLMLAGLIVVTALFVLAEYALVSIRPSRVDEMVQRGEPSARTIKSLKTDIERSIAGSQMGITLASMIIGWLGGQVMPLVAQSYVSFIPSVWGVSPGTIAFGIAFFILSIAHVVIGEQVPKQIALRLPERTIRILAKPFRVFCFVMAPVIWLMAMSAALLVKAFGLHKSQGGNEQHLPSADEFQILFEESQKAGTLDTQESNFLRRGLELKALTVREVMIPRTKMDAVSESITLPELLAFIAKTKHSKLPIYKGTEGVIGILNTRDLFEVMGNILKSPAAAATFKTTQFMRTAYFVPDSMQASVLLEEMRERRLQMAIVLDEFGAVVGLITLEDLVEQLVGEIWDEYDRPNVHIQAVGIGAWQILGEVTLFEFNKAFGCEIECQHCTSIAGAVIERLGQQPTEGDKVSFAGFDFEVIEMKGHAVVKLRVSRSNELSLGITGIPEQRPAADDKPQEKQ